MKLSAIDVLAGILFVGGALLVVLKLMGLVPLEWWQVLIPLGIVVAYWLLGLVIAVVGIVAIFLGGIIADTWSSGRGRKRAGVRRGR